MSKIKLVAIDIDGTLVNSQKEITAAVKEAIQASRQRGVKVVITTGRPLSGAKKYLKELNLDNAADEYVISFNGAAVETTAGEVIFQKGLNYTDYVDLEAIARKLNLHFHAVGLDRIYTAEKDIAPYTLYNSRIVNLGISYRTPAEMKNIRIIKAMYIDQEEYLDEQIQSPLLKAMQGQVNLSKTEPFYYEATAAGINKGFALKTLTEHLNLSSDQVMAIGDQANDLSMIEYAGVGVAMGNAVEITKAGADYVSADCDHDGVAVALNKFID